MTAQTFRKAVGIVFVTTPLVLNIPYAMLIARFNYPDILRQPAGHILMRFHEGGTGLVLTWWAFAVIGLPLIFAITGLHRLLQREDTPYLTTATVFGLTACIAQMIGLLRWTFVVPVLATTYADPAASQTVRDASVVMFQAVHQYGGVVIGEHIGQMFTILWMLMVSTAMFRSTLFRPWLGWFGIVSGVVYLAAQTELFATVIPATPVIAGAGLIGSLLWLLWMILIGVSLLRYRPVGHAAQA